MQQTFETAKKEAADAVENVHKKILETTGVTTNQELVGKVDTQATAFGNQLKGKNFFVKIKFQNCHCFWKIPDFASRFGEEASAQAEKFKPDLKSLASSLSDSAASLLGGGDKVRSDELQKSYGNVLTQIGNIQTRLAEEGGNMQKTIDNLFSQLLDTTRSSANNLAKQLDDSTQKPWKLFSSREMRK